MSGWSRTTKPSANTVIPANQIFGVDVGEAAAVPGIASPGWVSRRLVGTRVLYETLVAMKTGPDEVSDDTEIADFRIVITTQPASITRAAAAASVFTVAAVSAPVGATLTFQWQVSTDLGVSFANSVASGNTTATLTNATSTGLNNNQYRCVISTSGGALNVTSAPAILTVTA
jgi:hypothetical protein